VHQHVPVCAVELRAGATATEEALIGFSRSQIGTHAPSHVIILNKLPRDESGMLKRSALVKQIAQALGLSGKNEAAAAGPASSQLDRPSVGASAAAHAGVHSGSRVAMKEGLSTSALP
jgi:hypothetical protein